MPAAARLGDMDEGHECFPPSAIIAGNPYMSVFTAQTMDNFQQQQTGRLL